jgi:hypothetical protein
MLEQRVRAHASRRRAAAPLASDAYGGGSGRRGEVGRLDEHRRCGPDTRVECVGGPASSSDAHAKAKLRIVATEQSRDRPPARHLAVANP